MTREEAKEYAKEMTYRDAVYNALQGKCIPYRKATLIKLYELLDMVEQEPCENAISREDVLMCLTGEWTEITDEIIHRFIKRIKALPPVNTQPKWIPVSERLPEEEQRVLVTQIVRERTTVYCTRFPFEEIKEKYITAWMPLPAPFESYESEDKG